jgi:hypothetical protein
MMRAPSAAELLAAWERARTGPSALRAATLLSAAADGESADAIASASIGERDRRLLSLREATFGPSMVGIADCPSCGERIEWTARAAELCAPPAAAASELFVDVDGCRIRFRLPNSHDLSAASAAGDLIRARRLLLERCLLASGERAPDVDAGSLPEAWCAAISARMAEADPQADSALDLTCFACGGLWTEVFDIDSFFWAELTAWIERVLEEVHTLACAYGWHERDILNLSPWRRQFYLGLVGA